MKTNNKNRFFRDFSFSVYRYSPESFKLFYKGKEVKLSDDERFNMGYAAITAGKAEVLKHIKRWTRKKSTFAKHEHMPILAILSDDNSEYYHIGVRVNRYNITDKLSVYKWIKEAFNAGRFSTKTTTAKLDANYKPYDVREVQQEKKLGKRIVFI
jgi:hypothetical protein